MVAEKIGLRVARSSPRGRFRIYAFACALAALACMVGRIATGRSAALFTGDGLGYYAYLPSLLLDGDFDFTNQFVPERVPPPWVDPSTQDFYYAHSPVTGRRVNPFPIGPAIAWAPAFLAAHAVATGLRPFAGVRGDGFGLHYEIPVYLFSLALVLAGVYLTGRWLERRYAPEVAWSATLAAAVGTPFVAYQIAYLNMAHGLGALALVGFLVATCRATEQPTGWRPWAGVGIALAALFLMRWQNLLYGALVGAVWYRQWRGGTLLGTIAARGATVAVPFAVLVLPQLAVWRELYGSWITIPQNAVPLSAGGGAPYLAPGGHWPGRFLSLLFDPERGTLPVTPLVGLAAMGLAVARPPWRWLATALLVLLVAQLALVALSWDWHGGEPFGNRRLADATPIVALGCASWLERGEGKPSRGRSLAARAILLAAAWGLIRFAGYLAARA